MGRSRRGGGTRDDDAARQGAQLQGQQRVAGRAGGPVSGAAETARALGAVERGSRLAALSSASRRVRDERYVTAASRCHRSEVLKAPLQRLQTRPRPQPPRRHSLSAATRGGARGGAAPLQRSRLLSLQSGPPSVPASARVATVNVRTQEAIEESRRARETLGTSARVAPDQALERPRGAAPRPPISERQSKGGRRAAPAQGTRASPLRASLRALPGSRGLSAAGEEPGPRVPDRSPRPGPMR